MLVLNDRLTPYFQLARMDKPIGTLLLLWPTLWALWLAANGMPDSWVLTVFVLGTFLMRSAGCVINDFADRQVDGHVRRTAQRPLAQGTLREWHALSFFVGLSLLAFLLVLSMNALTVQLAFGGVILAICYPFMKRFTHLPQLVLGLAFSWAIPMAFAAQIGTIPPLAWLLFAANLCWTIAYDTMYAMVDREDDLKVGIKSTAILFGRRDKLIIGLLQLTTLFLLIGVGYLAALGSFYFLGLLAGAALFVYQQMLIKTRQREACFTAFLNNNYVGMAVFLGLMLDSF